MQCIINKTLEAFGIDDRRELGTYHEATALTCVTYLFYPSLTAGCLPCEAHNTPTSCLQFRIALMKLVPKSGAELWHLPPPELMMDDSLNSRKTVLGRVD